MSLSTGAPEGFQNALKLFRQAGERVPAYKDFLRKARINPKKVRTLKDFIQIPTIDKLNYVSKYTLDEMSWDGSLSARYVSSSSGSTGVPFYWPRGAQQDAVTGELYRSIFEDIFDTKQGKTLCVNLFALGTWIAGFEFYNATNWIIDKGNKITIKTPGIEKMPAIEAILKLAPSFDRIILAGYPPFLKDILELGAKRGLDWKKQNVHLLGAGESFSEVWRERVCKSIQKDNSFSRFINVYGMAEAGVVANETPFSIFARQVTPTIPTLSSLITRDSIVSPLYQYNPSTHFFETLENDSLSLTVNAGLPLIRYNTRDCGGILPHAELIQHLGQKAARFKKNFGSYGKKLPFVYLFGRKDLSISFYALNIYVENIKLALETFERSSSLSGLFVMGVGLTRKLDQCFEITVELSQKHASPVVLVKKLTSHITSVLSEVNSEYSKLYSTIGKKAIPVITLVEHGKIHTVPGRKHKWVKRS